MRVVMGTERVVAPVALAARTATPERAGETTGVDMEGTTEVETGVGGRAVMILARETAGGAATAIVAGTVATIGSDRAGVAGTEAITGVAQLVAISGVAGTGETTGVGTCTAGAAGTEVGETMGIAAEGGAVAKTGADGRDSGMADRLSLSFFSAAKMQKGWSLSESEPLMWADGA